MAEDERSTPADRRPRPRARPSTCPARTYLPVVTAFGLTLAVVGIVLSWIIVGIGVADHAVRGGPLDPARRAQDIAELPLEHLAAQARD